MELNVAYSNLEVETLGVSKSQKFGMAKGAEEIIFTMFTKNIYSNPIGSVVREITSNCFDSHKEANVTDPVILRLSKENSEYYISFTDVGVGMSPDRITKVYAQYFNSTKRNDNNQIGGFGIGGKTPLAYTESFFLITNFDGVKYTYNIRKGTSSPVLDLLAKTKTTDHNGTTVKIPIRSSDIGSFEREIMRQLYYFENVIFEGFSSNVKNDYQIIEGKNFLYRGNEYNQYVHICLGRVAYPIDFSVLDDEMDSNNEFYAGGWMIPAAIKMNIGEINVTVSREAIDYTAAAKKLIKMKLRALKDEMVEMLDKQHTKLDSLEEYYRMEGAPATLILSKTDSVNISSFTTNRLVKYHKMDALHIPTQAEVIHQFYDVSMFGKKGRRDHTWDKSVKTVGNDEVYFVEEGEDMPRKKNAYMKFTFKHFYSLKRKDLKISDVKLLIKNITPRNTTVSTKTIFNQFRELQKEVYKLVEGRTKKYSLVTVPAGFNVASNKTYNPNLELPITFNSRSGFNKERVKMESLAKCKATIYYGDLDDEPEIAEAYNHYRELFQPKEQDRFKFGYYDPSAFPVRFIMVSKSNLKYIKDLKNLKPISEFNSTLLRKRETLIKSIERKMFIDRFEKLNELFLNTSLFNAVDKKFAKKVSELLKLKGKYSAVKSIDLFTNNDSPIIKILNIDLSKITYQGHDLFACVETTTEKNGMLAYVRIDRNFDPNSKYREQKETDDILQLLKLAYVQ